MFGILLEITEFTLDLGGRCCKIIVRYIPNIYVERMMDLAYQLTTRTGRSFYEVTSAMQNSIRKGDYEVAGYCLWELLPKYTPYLRKRLLVISAEDCFGIITKEILALCEIGNEESLTKAVALLCAAKKNRDADYFVCNLMTSSGTDLDKLELAKQLHSAIRKRDVMAAGRYSAELFQKNRKEFWKMLVDTTGVYYPHLEEEVAALQRSNEQMTKPNEETIFVAKAIVLMWTVRSQKSDLLGYPTMRLDGKMDANDIPVPKPADECRRITGLFPDWAYNWHTTYGKYTLKRDAVHAIENDQWLLTPLEENLFDDCTWNRDINACLLKHNPNRHPIPYDDGKRRPEDKYGV